MRRISNEEGREAAARNIGRFFLSAIPAALGGAAVLWILAATGYVDLQKESRAERRLLASVGLEKEPTTPIHFSLVDAPCLKMDSAFMRDGDHFAFTARNACANWLKVPNYSYRLLAKDGTALESGTYAFAGDHNIGPSEKREQVVWIEHGIARVETIRIMGVD